MTVERMRHMYIITTANRELKALCKALSKRRSSRVCFVPLVPSRACISARAHSRATVVQLVIDVHVHGARC